MICIRFQRPFAVLVDRAFVAGVEEHAGDDDAVEKKAVQTIAVMTE
jgi:hypothetical protein